MQCPRCRQSTPLDAEFCPQCGVKLLVGCWRCGTGNAIESRFCKKCGQSLAGPPAGEAAPHVYTPPHLAEKILQTRAAIEGERKFITVLFADLKGSMEVLAGRDPEEIRRVLDGALRRMMGAVHRFEGTVNQVLGDGIMALFGAPLAYEDHAVRACHAALGIKSAVQRYAEGLAPEGAATLQIRIGLNSGLVVVRSIGSDLHMDYTAIGETTHLAARMEQIASPDSICITEETWRLAQPFVSATLLGLRPIKGLANPIPVYELQAVRPALPGSQRFGGRRRASRFVGRERELHTLEQALESSMAGEACVLGIAGHPGVGKSRLCYEFTERCRSRSLPVWQARGVAHGRALPFLLLLDFLRDYFGIAPNGDGLAARRKIEERMPGSDAAFANDLALVLDVLGIADAPKPAIAPEARQHQLMDAIKRIIRLETLNAFSVFILEDLQWLDSGSGLFVEALVDVVQTSRALLVVTFRSPYSAPWMQRSCYQQLPLPPLRRAAADELVHGLVGADASVAAITEEILARAGGNPFFIEELVQSLVESGHLRGSLGAYQATVKSLSPPLPATVQAVLGARIDRLADTEKEVLQTAAVVGKEFSAAVLQRVAGVSDELLEAALHRLSAGEFIVEQPTEGLYGFRHPLTQEVAYQSQLLDRRKRLHADVARVLEELNPDRLDELAGLIAFHREAAGDAGAAATWCARAATWIGPSNPAQATAYWAKVRELLAAQPESPTTTTLRILACGQLLNLGWREGIAPEEAARYFGEASELARRAGDIRAHALVTAAYGRILTTRGSADEYVAQVEAAHRLAETSNDASLRVTVLSVLCHAYRTAGRLRDAMVVNETALAQIQAVRELDSRLLGFSAHLWLLGMRGLFLTYFGQLEEARTELDDLSERVKTDRNLALQLLPSVAYTEIAALRGDEELSAHHASVARDLAERSASAYVKVYAYAAEGIARTINGRWSRAVEVLDEGLAFARRTNCGLEYEPRMLTELAEARLRMGEAQIAFETAREAVAVAIQRRSRVGECQAQLVLATSAMVLSGTARPSPAEAALQRAEQLVHKTGADVYQAHVRAQRARLAALAGDPDAERHHREQAEQLFARLGASRYAVEVDALYRRLLR